MTDTTNAEPLLAGSIMTNKRSNVVWPLHMLRRHDRVRVSAMLPYAAVVDVETGALPVLRKLTVHADLDGATDLVELVVPADTTCTLISAMRVARPTCRACHRRCEHPYDAADSTPPFFAICVDCDQRITAEVRAQMTEQARVEEEVATDADDR